MANKNTKTKIDIRRDKESLARKRNLVLMLFCLAIAVAAGFAALSYLDDNDTNTSFRKRFNDYNDGWNIIVDETRTMEDLPAYTKSGSDNVIILKKVLPDPIPKYSAIAVRNYHQKMEVIINGEVVYTYPDEDTTNIAKVISDEWSIINLKSDSSRGVLEIKYTNESIFPFKGYIGDVYFGDDNSMIEYLRHSNLWAFISGIIMIIIGIILIIISWIYRKPTNQKPNTAMGLSFFCFGLWLVNRSKMPFLSTNNSAIFLFSLYALLLVAPFIFLYAYYRNQEFRNVSLICFRVLLVYAGFIFVTSFFIRHNVEVIAMIAYISTLLGFLFNAFLLFRASFGPGAKYKSRMELLLNRSEFFSNMIFPPAGVIEMIISRHELWTEVSNFFRVVLVIYAAIYMVFVLWRTYLVVQDRVVVSERLQESQLELMMGQIQPHFIFNTLSSIRTLVKVDPDVAYKMLYDFSNYLRANVDNVTNMEGIKFAAEVNHIKSYVNIEKVRFGDRLNVEYEIGEDDFMVPPLSIQPLVENAIKHGAVKKIEGGDVYLRSYKTDTHNIVEVEDTGIGFNSESASKVFSVYVGNEDKVGMESNKVMISVMQEVINSMDLRDENGEPIKITAPIEVEDLSGNGSEEHKSKGMINIILRLKEMSDADLIISSRTGVGTKIKVLFPIQKEE